KTQHAEFILSEVFSPSGASRLGGARRSLGHFLAPSARTERGGTMHVLADRFAVDERGRAIDLATGARVAIATNSNGGVAEQARWAARCAWWHRLRHRAIAPLVDFGLIGECARFEAFACRGVWRGSPDEARAVHERATRFLHGTRRLASAFAHDRVGARGDGR